MPASLLYSWGGRSLEPVSVLAVTLCWPGSLPLHWAEVLASVPLNYVFILGDPLNKKGRALNNRRQRHLKIAEVKVVNIFKSLFAIISPNLASLLSCKRRCRIFGVKKLSRRYSEGSQLHETLIYPTSENSVSSGIVFIESVLSRNCCLHYLTSIFTIIWGGILVWNLHPTHQEVEDWNGDTCPGSEVDLTGLNITSGLNVCFPLYYIGNVLHYYCNVRVNKTQLTDMY